MQGEPAAEYQLVHTLNVDRMDENFKRSSAAMALRQAVDSVKQNKFEQECLKRARGGHDISAETLERYKRPPHDACLTIDTGCQRTAVGIETLRRYFKQLNEGQRTKFQETCLQVQIHKWSDTNTFDWKRTVQPGKGRNDSQTSSVYE